MKDKNLVIVIEANQPYIRNTEPGVNFLRQNSPLFYAITHTFIPLVDTFRSLERDGVPFKLTLVLSPTLCSLLSDAEVMAQYTDYLDKLVELGKSEVKRCDGTPYSAEAAAFLESAERTKALFEQDYGKNLIQEIKHFEDKGFLDLIPTAATYAYLPHYVDMPEALNAQIEAGLFAQTYFFGKRGTGFYVPYKGWAPGVSKALRSCGIVYTILDARSVLFSPDCPATGIFAPSRTRDSLVVFGADLETPEDIAGAKGFTRADVYRANWRDAGYELGGDALCGLAGSGGERIPTGCCYLSNKSKNNSFVPYNRAAARAQAARDAEAFYEKKARKLARAKALLGDKSANLVCTIPARLIGQTWHEGVDWLEALLRIAAERGEVTSAFCEDLLENRFSLTRITPYPCSSGGFGHGEDLVDGVNSRLVRYVRKATERMIDLADRFPAETSLKERFLNMAAKEVLLAQSSSWPRMLHDGEMPEFAADCFKEKILTFTDVFDSLASDSVSTKWLTARERRDPLFPWFNYRLFSKKL